MEYYAMDKCSLDGWVHNEMDQKKWWKLCCTQCQGCGLSRQIGIMVQTWIELALKFNTGGLCVCVWGGGYKWKVKDVDHMGLRPLYSLA